MSILAYLMARAAYSAAGLTYRQHPTTTCEET